MLDFFLKGLIIGFAIAAPVGPIGVLCIQRSLHDGFKVGLMTGMGAALADGIYGFIAGFGLTALSSLFITYQFWIRILGGIFLIYLGIKLFFKIPTDTQVRQFKKSPWPACITTFFLTLANPSTILSFIAIFAGLGLGMANTDYVHAVSLVLGIILGSACWWLLLSGGVAFILHRKLGSSFMREINRVSGLVILLFGIFAMILGFYN